jgi:hypothetical protein
VETDSVKLPPLRALVRHAVPHLVEATVIPLCLFYLFLAHVGIWGAILASLTWSYGALARRLVRGERLPGLLLLGAVGITTRTVVTFVSGSTFIYFLQPSVTTAAVGGLFILSLASRCPLAERLVGDLFPLSPALIAQPGMRRAFVRLTALWALVNFLQAGVAISLLVSQPVAVYVWARTVASLSITGTAFAISGTLLIRAARRAGVPPLALTLADVEGVSPGPGDFAVSFAAA